MFTAGTNIISGNFIGTDVAGASPAGNGGNGLLNGRLVLGRRWHRTGSPQRHFLQYQLRDSFEWWSCSRQCGSRQLHRQQYMVYFMSCTGSVLRIADARDGWHRGVQRLQASEDTRSIPVIFVTARSSKEGKLEGLGVGAVDYITKPIDLDETLARVQTQLRFAAINREIIDLQRRLTESRRAATIGAVTQGIAHNLNNLLGVVIGYLDLIKAYADKPEWCGRTPRTSRTRSSASS